MKKVKIVHKTPIKDKFKEIYQYEIDSLELGAAPEYLKPGKQDADILITLGKDATAEFVDMNNYYSFNDTVGYMFHIGDMVVIPSHHPNDWFPRKEVKDASGRVSVTGTSGYSVFIKKVLHKASLLQGGFTEERERLLVDHTRKELVDYLDSCLKSSAVCIDLETSTERDGIPNKLTAIGISKSADEALCVSEDQEGFKLTLSYLKRIMENKDICKIGQNIVNFDSQVLYHRHGISLYGDVWDTLDAFKVLYPDLNRASLGVQGSMYLLTTCWKDESWRAKGKELRTYCAKDVVRTFRIAKAQKEDMQIQGNLGFFKRVIMPTLSPLARALHKGINFDHTERNKQREQFVVGVEELKERLAEMAKPYLPPKEEVKLKRDQPNDQLIEVPGLVIPEDFQKMKKGEILELLKPYFSEKELKEVYLAKKTEQTRFGLKAGSMYKKAYKEEVLLKNRTYNPASSQQTLAVFEAMGIDVPTKRSTDGTWKPATGSLQLQQILFKYADREKVVEFTQTLQEYKPLAKFLTGYLNAEFLEDGRWRSQFNLVGTETTRASSKRYFDRYCGNVQNIPSRSKLTNIYKKCFIPDPGYVFFNFDQKSAETYIQAYLADDANMLRILNNGIDMHSETARLMFGYTKTDEELKGTDDREIIAKTYNHLSAYDGSDFVVSGMLTAKKRVFTIDQIKDFASRWHNAYKGIRGRFHKEVREKLEAGEPLVNPLGLRRYFTFEVSDRNVKQAYAHIPQSTVPGVSNLMWQWVDKNYKDEDAMVLIQTHDSLSGQVKKEIADEFCKRFVEAAKEIKLTINGNEFSIPWTGGVGSSYYECK